MSNPILLSETQECLYYGIPTRKDRTDFTISEAGNLFSKDQQISSDVDLRGSEIIGILGKDSEVSEEVAKEILKPFKIITQLGIMYALDKRYSKINDALKSLIKSKGILIENPIEKPLRDNYLVLGTLARHSYEGWQIDLKRWQSFEDKLVKVVLIKVKK